MKKMNKKGFTLIEMLVVIAIIAILVSIVLPTVTAATEKAKEAKDAANIRSAIAEVTTQGLSNTGTTDITKTVTLTQSGSFDQNPDMKDIAGYTLDTFKDAKTVTVTYVVASNTVTVTANK